MFSSSFRFFIFCFCLVLSQYIVTPQPTLASQTNQVVQIAFVSDRDGNNEIYIMDADGSNIQRLTENSASDDSPVWSPDGERIAFVSDLDGEKQIYVMDADGSNVHKLTPEDSIGDFPVWSPDSEQLLFIAGDFRLHLINADSSNDTILDETLSQVVYAVWSPDGQHIAYADAARGIFVISPTAPIISNEGYRPPVNGSVAFPTGYTEDFSPIFLGSLAFSQDSQHLFMTLGSYDIPGLYISDLENEEFGPPRALDYGGAVHAVWSPDGKSIIYTDFDNNGYLMSIDSDGTNQHALYEETTTTPQLSADGQQILFESSDDLFVMDADGSNVHNLTNSPSKEWNPVWRH